MNRLFLDTSVIIDHLNNSLTPAVAFLRSALGTREIVIGDLVLLEVLQGLRDERSARLTESVLAPYRCFELGGAGRARDAAAVYRQLRAAGITPRSTTDVLIATYCSRERLELLASDRDFRLMAPHIGLELAGPSIS